MHEEVESLIIAYPYTSAVSGVFYCYILQNKQSRRHSLCSEMTRCFIRISNNVKYLDKEQSCKNSTKEVTVCNQRKYWTKCTKSRLCCSKIFKLKVCSLCFLATKEYVYLDGLLTSYLLELDKITTDGYEEVRIARKSAVQSIQMVLNYLECKGG